MPIHSQCAIIVVAAGRGLRAGGDVPKQYAALCGRPVIAHTIEALHTGVPDARIVCVIHPDDAALFATASSFLSPKATAKLDAPVQGRATRQQSVRAGLEYIARHWSEPPSAVLIHDAARPFVSKALLARALDAALESGAAVPGLAVTDTLKQVDDKGHVVVTPERASLRAVQTPQAFGFDLILAAHRAADMDNLTDDAAIAEKAGHQVLVFEGEGTNMKITLADDLAKAENHMLATLQDIRTGQGYDVHAFGPGDGVWLGGVKIPHTHALVGHSDADVLLHAITDAILGALADGDIGAHFPPSDPQWRGAASSVFLADAMARVRAKGGMVAHLDATLICEMPKIGPHRDTIRTSIAQITGLELDRIAIKATTSEQLGFTGRREGMAAMAIATVRLP